MMLLGLQPYLLKEVRLTKCPVSSEGSNHMGPWSRFEMDPPGKFLTESLRTWMGGEKRRKLVQAKGSAWSRVLR